MLTGYRKGSHESGAFALSGAIFVLVIRSYGTRNPGISGLSRERTVNRSGTRATEFYFNSEGVWREEKNWCVVGALSCPADLVGCSRACA